MRTAKIGEPLTRGVWVESYMGENFELVLVAVRRDGRRVCPPVTIKAGENSVQIAEDLWDFLEREDPDLRAQLKVV